MPANARKKRLAKAERRQHYRLMSQVYALCRSREWTVRYVRLKNLDGVVNRDADEILLDPRSDVIATFLHECLHVILDDRFDDSRDDEEEKEVCRLERLMLRHLSPAQARRLHAHIHSLLLANRRR